MEIKCTNCGAEIEAGVSMATAECPFCGSSSVIERSGSEVQRPGFAIGFALEKEQAVAGFRQWIRRKRNFLQINMDFVEQALEREIRGIYLPAFMFGARCDAQYSASIGENYQETETEVVDGKTQTRVVTKTEWRTLQGNLTEYLPDILVTASTGVQNTVLEAVEPFDYSLIRRFDPRLTSGWISEIPTLSQEEIIGLAKAETEEKMRKRLRNFMPGDSVRNLSFESTFSEVSLDLIQIPVWSLRVPRGGDKPPIHLLLNGQTGKCGGKIPYSAWRIALFAAAVVAVVCALIFAGST